MGEGYAGRCISLITPTERTGPLPCRLRLIRIASVKGRSRHTHMLQKKDYRLHRSMYTDGVADSAKHPSDGVSQGVKRTCRLRKTMVGGGTSNEQKRWGARRSSPACVVVARTP